MPLPHSDKAFPKEDQVLFGSDSPQPSDFECMCQCFLIFVRRHEAVECSVRRAVNSEHYTGAGD